MRNGIVTILSAAVVLSMIMTSACKPVDTNASSYGEDRALIEDLQARYMFALDFVDPETYALTFTEDGVLDIVGLQWQGREEIKKMLEGRLEAPSEGKEETAQEEASGPYPSTGRHNITNIVLKIDGDKAVGRAYWFHMGNDNPERKGTFDSYGHYEDEMVKVDGQWLFSKRVIYNEQMAEWIGPTENPCW